VGFQNDISERKKIQRHLLQSEKMAAVGQMAGGVAHEINNPLGVILGFSQSLLSRIKEGDPILMPLKSIEREANRCKIFAQDLLTFSRAGKTEKEECDLNDVIEGALSLIEAQTKVKSVDLAREFDRTIPKVLTNGNQVQQVVINLCNNAIDAMPKGGRLTVRTYHALKGDQEFVGIDVEDTGTGIPKEIQSKIYEPFFTTKEVGKGTGLGLSLVYEIVQNHQGFVELESEAGKGAKFKISLPARPSVGPPKF
jgi:signal transduction histidine kinase